MRLWKLSGDNAQDRLYYASMGHPLYHWGLTRADCFPSWQNRGALGVPLSSLPSPLLCGRIERSSSSRHGSMKTLQPFLTQLSEQHDLWLRMTKLNFWHPIGRGILMLGITDPHNHSNPFHAGSRLFTRIKIFLG
jgi:hypothetical protein